MTDSPSAVRVKLPHVGMLAKIRRRRAIIASVEASRAAGEGVLHQVRVEYTDSPGVPEDTVIWEREVGCELLEPHALPRVSDEPPMRADRFDALCRATRRPFAGGKGVRGQHSYAAVYYAFESFVRQVLRVGGIDKVGDTEAIGRALEGMVGAQVTDRCWRHRDVRIATLIRNCWVTATTKTAPAEGGSNRGVGRHQGSRGFGGDDHAAVHHVEEVLP